MNTIISVLSFPADIILVIAGFFKAKSVLTFFQNNVWAYFLCSIVLWIGIFGALIDYIKKKIS
jgi:hypothetical protein